MANLSKEQMIKAVAQSKNKACAAVCQRILKGETTIEHELKYSGGFMSAVLKGDYEWALVKADYQNRIALLNYKD